MLCASSEAEMKAEFRDLVYWSLAPAISLETIQGKSINYILDAVIVINSSSSSFMERACLFF